MKRLTGVITGHGTIPLPQEGVAAGRGRGTRKGRQAVAKRDGRLLQYVNSGYETMHLFLGYDGSKSKKVCDAGFEYANAIINQCASLMPKPVCA